MSSLKRGFNQTFSFAEEKELDEFSVTAKVAIGVGCILLNPVLLVNLAVYSTIKKPWLLSIYNFFVGNLGKMTMISMKFMLDQFKHKKASDGVFTRVFKGFVGLVGVLAISTLIYGSGLVAAGVASVASAAMAFLPKIPSLLMMLARVMTAPA